LLIGWFWPLCKALHNGQLPPVETDVSVANNSGLHRMIAGSVANYVGLNDRHLHLIPVENCADCWFVGI